MLVVFAGTVSKGVILLDYAAISYMFSDQNLFISYHDLTDSEYITISGEHCISALGIGSVKITVILLHGSSILIFNNVLFILLLGTNLISPSTWQHRSTSVQSWEKSLIVSKDGEDLFSTVFYSLTGTIYQIQHADLF